MGPVSQPFFGITLCGMLKNPLTVRRGCGSRCCSVVFVCIGLGGDHIWTEAAARGAFYMLTSDLTLTEF